MKNVSVTELELSILQRIWEQGNQSTVGTIVDEWPEETRPGYTTVLKTLQKMEKKGIVGHKAEGKKYLYFPKVSKEKITSKRLNTIIDRIFSGDKLSFVEYFVNSSSFSATELEEIKELILAKENESR